MSVKCVLFDLDGTLVTTGGAGVFALDRAFETVFGVPQAMRSINPAGKTDPAIIREIFRQRLGRDCTASEMAEIQSVYLRFLPEECERSAGYAVIRAIPEILGRLQSERILTGLGTGNLEQGARIKLARGGLNPYLPFGGYGSDAEERSEVLKAGHRKAEEFCGGRIASEDVWVVGDTERDVEAARRAEFKVVAVATGHCSCKELEACRPDFFLPDFGNGSEFLKIVRGE